MEPTNKDRARQADAIQVTPQMIEAGLGVLSFYEVAASDPLSEVVREVYLAMSKSRPAQGRS